MNGSFDCFDLHFDPSPKYERQYPWTKAISKYSCVSVLVSIQVYFHLTWLLWYFWSFAYWIMNDASLHISINLLMHRHNYPHLETSVALVGSIGSVGIFSSNLTLWPTKSYFSRQPDWNYALRRNCALWFEYYANVIFFTGFMCFFFSSSFSLMLLINIKLILIMTIIAFF